MPEGAWLCWRDILVNPRCDFCSFVTDLLGCCSVINDQCSAERVVVSQSVSRVLFDPLDCLRFHFLFSCLVTISPLRWCCVTPCVFLLGWMSANWESPKWGKLLKNLSVCVCVLFSHQGQDTLYVDLCSFFVAMYGFLWCALLVLIAVSLVESVSLFKCNLCLPFLPCICLFDSSKFEGRIWLFSYSREFLIRFQVSLSFLREKPSGFYQRLFDVDEPSNTIQNHS